MTFFAGYSLIGLILGHNQGGRAIGFMGEAGDLASILLPAIIYYVYIRKIDWKLVLILLDFILALSAASIVALGIVIFVLYVYPLFISKKHFKRKIFYLLSLVLLCEIGWNKMSQDSESLFIKRFQETIEGLDVTKLEYKDLELFNSSTYAWLTNIKVALEAPSRLLGTGLGTHKDSYEKLNPEIYPSYRLYGLNKDDAYSITTRVYSELGLVGLIFMICFLWKNTNRQHVGNVMALGYLINRLLTGGHCTATGMFLFLFLFYYTRKDRFYIE